MKKAPLFLFPVLKAEIHIQMFTIPCSAFRKPHHGSEEMWNTLSIIYSCIAIYFYCNDLVLNISAGA